MKKKSSENANIFQNYYMQYSEQAHKILASSHEKNGIFLSQEKVCFQEFIVRKRVPLPHFLLQISVPIFIPHNIYLYRKTYVIGNLLLRNDATVSNVLKQKMTADKITLSWIWISRESFFMHVISILNGQRGKSLLLLNQHSAFLNEAQYSTTPKKFWAVEMKRRTCVCVLILVRRHE